MLPVRMQHPVRDYRIALANYQAVCSVRGYCGPFTNELFYNAFPDSMWHGYGECLVCCSTVLIAHEEEKRRKIETAAAESLPSGQSPAR